MRISRCMVFGSAVFLSLLLSSSLQADDHNANSRKDQNHPRPNNDGGLSQYRPIGGTDNNRDNPGCDPVPGMPELALAPLNFAPHTNNGLVDGPNPRTLSNVLAGGTGAQGQNAETQEPIASAWLYVFGQFVDHDLDLESTPPTTAAIDISVPSGDPVFKGASIAMTRDLRDPNTNTIINTVAGYLDLSQLYGSTPEIAASLRNSDGTLKSSYNGKGLMLVDGQFVTGDPRAMENPELTAATILFMREHNFWANRLHKMRPQWSGDTVYNMARAITIGEYQNIVFKEFVPLMIGTGMGPYRGYDSRYCAQVTQEFSTAAFRMGHSNVSDTQEGLDNQGNVVFTESLAQAFFNTPDDTMKNGIDPLLRGVSADFSQYTDVYAVPVLRNLLFAPLVGGDIDQVDLIAIDIQRERDVGIGTLNQTRKALGLRPYRSFAELTDDAVLQRNFAALYGDIDQVDLFMGGLAEKHVQGAVVGQTFQVIIARQFYALRAGDRYYWENEDFDDQTNDMIAHTTLGDIIKRNTDTLSLQANVFLVPGQPTHVKQHQWTSFVDTHGLRGRPFITR